MSYVRTPQGPYVGTVDTTVTVTATLADGFEWGQMPAGWMQVDLVTASFTVSLVGTICAVVTPVGADGEAGGVRRRGRDAHTITSAPTDGITYTLSPAGNPAGTYPASPAQSVTVTATLAPTGVGWPDPLAGRVDEGEATTATFTVELPAVTCTPVQPVAPDGDAGDVCRGCGDGADGGAGHHAGGGLLRGGPQAPTAAR